MSERKKILVTTTHFFPHVGGVEKYTLDFFSALKQRYPEIEITILTLQTSLAPQRETIQGLSVVRVPSFWPDLNPLFFPGTVKKILEEIEFSSFDLVITQCRYYFFTTYISWLAAQKRVPIAHIEHNAGYMVHKNFLVTRIAWLYDHFFGSAVLKRALFLVAVSQSVKTFLQEKFRVFSKIEVISGGVSLKYWGMIDKIPDTRMFVYCGRLLREKGIFLLLDAFEVLSKKYPEIKLFIIGSGPEEKTCQSRVIKKGLGGRVTFLGKVSSETIQTLYKERPVFVNPSFYTEGLQISLLEAAASGLPIITTQVGGVKELLEANKSALFVIPQESESLAAAMEEYILLPEKAKQHGRAAFQNVSTSFSQEEMAEKFYQYVLS